MTDTKVYCVYHDTELVRKYNLIEHANIKLYYTKTQVDSSINHLEKFFNEFVAQYCIWKHNKYSDVVGFCHYNRPIDVNHNIVKTKGFECYELSKSPAGNIEIFFKAAGLDYLINEKFKEHVKANYPELYDDFCKYLVSENSEIAYRERYACKWEIFDQLMNLLTKFFSNLLDVDDLCNMSAETLDSIVISINNTEYARQQKFVKDNPDKDLGFFFGYPRCLAFCTEMLIGIFFGFFVYKFNNIENGEV